MADTHTIFKIVTNLTIYYLIKAAICQYGGHAYYLN